MPTLPQGTVTFLFTDVETSTRTFEQHPQAYRDAIARHHVILRETVETHNGCVFETVGDAVYAAFARSTDALTAALSAQLALRREPWGDTGPLKVRMALHTGDVELWDAHYFGPPLYRCGRLMAAAHGEQIILSAVTMNLVHDELPAEVQLHDLGEHRLRDLTRSERIYQILHPILPREFPPLRTLESRPHNLPVQATALIGRSQETDALRQRLLHPDTRLITLTGPGGVGKTRLGLHVAAECIEHFSDGVFFVGLASLTDVERVIVSIVRTLGLRDTADRSQLEALEDILADKHLLLVLDNFEHLMEAATQVAQLLTACPFVKFLVTSRSVLHIYGEREFAVPPLSLPDPRHLPPISELRHYEAIQLFLARAMDIKPDFIVTKENAPALVEICRHLDGLPLALELAAARIKILTPQAMLSRLGRRLSLLTGGPRDAPARQQTLRNTIAWSYTLLPVSEQTVFCRLAIFVGGCTLEAAETIIGEAIPDMEFDVLNAMATLVDNSLLRQEETANGELRFHMLETIREYALEQLESSDEGDSLQQQHATFFLALAEQAEPELFGPQTAAWLDRLEQEHDNLRAALQWFIEHNETDHILRLGAALGRFWRMHGHLTEGRERLLTLLALDEEKTAYKAERARVLLAAGWLARDLADYDTARVLVEEALVLDRELGETGSIAWALLVLGVIARYQGDHATARSQLEEGLGAAQELGDKVCIAATVGNLGLVARDQGDYHEARQLLEQSLALARELGDSLGIAWPLTNLGLVAQYQGDYAAAHALHTEALALYRSLGDKQNIAYSLNNLALVATAQGNYTTAEASFRESLHILSEVRDRRGIAFVLEGLACGAAVQSQPHRALCLASAATTLRQAIGSVAPPSWQQMCAGHLETAWHMLDAHSAATSQAKGQAMLLEQAIDYALAGPISE